MTGVIITIPPTVELPPGSTTGGSAVLPGVTFTYAVLSLPQTWTAKQTFLLGSITLQAADIVGLASSATLDTTNASNITSGTLPAARLPTPTASTLGGVKSLANVSHKWLNSIGTDGTPTQTQPDAADVAFTATSGTQRAVNSRLADVYSVLDYGADPAGVADSAPAFRTALAAVPYGGTLFIPAGTYLLNSSVNGAILDFTNFPNKGIALRGVGWQLKVGSDYTTPSGSILKIGSSIPNTVDFYKITPTQQVSGMGFRDFAVIPSGGVYTQPFGRHGINIDTTAGTTGYVDFLYVDNIFIDNFAAGWGFYVHGLASPGNTLISSVIQNSSFMATKFVNIADDVSFLNNVYGANALTYVSAATVAAGGSGGANGTQTVTVSGGTGTAATLNVTVSGGAITAVNSVISGGFYTIFPTSPAAVTGAGLTGATVNLTQLFPNMGIDASQVSGATSLKIIGNNFVSQDGAIRVTAGLTPVIRDNEIEQNPGNNTTSACINITSGTFVVGAVITGNSISNNASGSISPIFVGAAQGAVIFANTIYVPTGGSHATISASATNTRILDNTCYVNGALVNNGTWTNSGTGTAIVETYTGTGALVQANSPTLVTPALGAATATTINGAALDNLAWTSYTPTVTAQGGTITTYTATGRYKQIGKTVLVQMDVTLTTVGSATGSMQVTLPFTAAAFRYAGSCYEYTSTGKSGAGFITSSGTFLSTRVADATSWFTNGNTIACAAVYELP